MSAIVCGKRSFFEESLPVTTTTPLSKRFRCSSTSPIRLSPSITNNSFNPFYHSLSSSPEVAGIHRLKALFPEMDEKFLERAFEESGDLESAIKRLNELRLGSAERNPASATVKADLQSQEINGGNGAASEDATAPSNLPKNGAEWVEVLVKEMTSASDIEDARARASRVLEVLEKSIRSQAGAEISNNILKENEMLKEQMEVMIRENGILKRAVAIQHERQKEADNKNQEVQQLKQLISQYQERLRTLEVNNYALTMHLRQAEQSSSIPGCFNPDVF